MESPSPEISIRLAAFVWLAKQVALLGDVLPWKPLATGFDYRGERVPLLSQQGIFKPRVLRLPLSMRTASRDPYKDETGTDGVLRYAYRGTDPWHRDNVGLRTAMQERLPLVYFFGIAEGKYVAAWPVFIVGDDPAALRFTVALDDASRAGSGFPFAVADGAAPQVAVAPADEAATARREYITSTFQRRLHQSAFRERVLSAYRSQCALCHLRHQELLDAAHIIPDTEPDGHPVVPNGLALCKLHHAAYDRNFLTVTPGYVIEVRRAILDENDGPMLLHGLKEMHGKMIELPRQREMQPDRERLERRWKRFREAG